MGRRVTAAWANRYPISKGHRHALFGVDGTSHFIGTGIVGGLCCALVACNGLDSALDGASSAGGTMAGSSGGSKPSDSSGGASVASGGAPSSGGQLFASGGVATVGGIGAIGGEPSFGGQGPCGDVPTGLFDPACSEAGLLGRITYCRTHAQTEFEMDLSGLPVPTDGL